jgi:hypothetical protein
MDNEQEKTITLTLTERQALAVFKRLSDRQRDDRRNMKGFTPEYRIEMEDIDAVVHALLKSIYTKPVSGEEVVKRSLGTETMLLEDIVKRVLDPEE